MFWIKNLIIIFALILICNVNPEGLSYNLLFLSIISYYQIFLVIVPPMIYVQPASIVHFIEGETLTLGCEAKFEIPIFEPPNL